MTNERRSETPVNDTKLRTEVSVSVVIQGLMLIGIVSMVTVTMGLRVDMAKAIEIQRIMLTTQQDHEKRIRTNEADLARVKARSGD